MSEEWLDGPNLGLRPKKYVITQNICPGDCDKSSIGHCIAGSEGTETVINQASITHSCNPQLTCSHTASRQSEHGESSPEAIPDTAGVGDHDEAVSSGEVNLISR